MSNILIHDIDWTKLPLKKSIWTVYRVDADGDDKCSHDFITITGYTKEYVNKLRPGEETNDVYNKFGEQVVHQLCSKCDRKEVIIENIIFEYYKDISSFKEAKAKELTCKLL